MALAGDGVDVLEVSAQGVPEGAGETLDVLVVDGTGADDGGAAGLLADAPRTLLVVVLSSPDRAAAEAALRAGARGVVAAEELHASGRAAVAAVAAGQIVLPASYAPASSRALLSAREKQVLSMVVLGFTNLDVANKLFIAETTVKSHLSSAYRKLGVSSRQEATALILSEQGLGLGILTLSGERVSA
jgi:DNA-binding NarL/FixJ family response regulator